MVLALRIALGVCALLFLIVYLFVLVAALITSGNELIRAFWAWYAALAPTAYASFCLLYAFGFLRKGLSPKRMFLLHVPFIPALVVSFMGLGLWLLCLAMLLRLLYWKIERADRH